MTPSTEYLTVQETAAFVSVTAEAVYQRIGDGKMASFQKYGRTVVLRSEAREWQKARHRQALIMLGELKK